MGARFDAASFRWQGVEERPYKDGAGWAGVARFRLAARDGFEVRYFEIAPGGYSSLEKHEHAHVVMAIRGRGRALVGREVVEMAPFDVVETPPLAPHRWVNAADEPFGFLCTVDADRDRPQPLSQAEREQLAADPLTAPFIH
jgi:S-methyl-1-thioxylulose 5-phosphate methylthiotransferase